MLLRSRSVAERGLVSGGRLDEALDVATGLWTGEPPSYDGEYFQIGRPRSTDARPGTARADPAGVLVAQHQTHPSRGSLGRHHAVPPQSLVDAEAGPHGEEETGSPKRGYGTSWRSTATSPTSRGSSCWRPSPARIRRPSPLPPRNWEPPGSWRPISAGTRRSSRSASRKDRPERRGRFRWTHPGRSDELQP